MKQDQVKLPSLVFGDLNAKVESDIQQYGQKMSRVITSLQYYESLDDPAHFRSKSCPVSINGMRLVAGANTPVAVAIDDTADITLLIPFHGENHSIVDRNKYTWRAEETAVLLPATRRGGSSTMRSTLSIDLNPDRLQATARAMLGRDEDQPVDLAYDQARTLALNYGQVSFSTLFRKYCQMIDALIESPLALNRLGVDESLYRSIVMLLNPALFLADDEADRTFGGAHQRRLLDKVCEYVHANLDARITLSDLETISGLSRRTLQYAFMKRYGCTPMQWVRQHRLESFYRRVKAPEPGDTVLKIAVACGFTDISSFSRFYRSVYGELPSTTLSRYLQD